MISIFAVWAALSAPPPSIDISATLDVLPQRCENYLDRKNRSLLIEATLLGSPQLDVTRINLDTVIFERKHGLGDSVAPLVREPVIQDVPSLGTDCDCELSGPDGIADATFQFSAAEVIDELWLDLEDAGETIKVALRGRLLDGTSFSAEDCFLLMRPVVSTFDVSYGPHAEQVLNIYSPLAVAPTGPAPGDTTGTNHSELPARPVLLFLHGTGDVPSHQNLEPLFWRFPGFLDRGITIVSADYGGWPTTNFPSPQQHIVECVEWMHAHADEYGWDMSKFAIGGRSFGAMLGSAVTYGQFGLADRPAAFIALDGMLDWTVLDSTLPFEIVQHFGPGLMKTANVQPHRLEHASGTRVIQDWDDPTPPPPAYCWAVGRTLGAPPIQDLHDPYFGNLLVDILRTQFGRDESVVTYGAPVDTNVVAEWYLELVE